MFQPTLPLRGATIARGLVGSGLLGFNPRSPCGERPALPSVHMDTCQFQPTLPLRGATLLCSSKNQYTRSFNPRSPCGERHYVYEYARPHESFNPRSPCGERRQLARSSVLRRVSTHAPLAGSDFTFGFAVPATACFNPRSPCGERPRRTRPTRPSASFNPRSPCGERRAARLWRITNERFNPRSPCGERRSSAPAGHLGVLVSTHAPLAGSDAELGLIELTTYVFQPTLPLRGATRCPSPSSPGGTCFNPRSPCGERPHEPVQVPWMFQPTLPLRGATWQPVTRRCFNPRSPCGERRADL